MSKYRVSAYDAPKRTAKTVKPGTLPDNKIPIFDHKGNRRGHVGRLASSATVSRFTGTVSYTHLDVYKRQPCDFEKDLRKGFAQVPDGESHAALAPADLPAAFKALPDTDAGRAVQFQILTAARPGAVEAATWSQIVENGTMAWEYTILKLSLIHI